MKLIRMADRKDEPGAKPPSNPPKPRKAEAAFDIWLQRGLHQLFDDVAREPVPEELLRLIEEDRDGRKE